MINIKIQSGLS